MVRSVTRALDGIWGAITDTVSGIIRGAGDYVHEKFLGRNQYPGSDQAYYAPYGPEAPAHGQVSGHGAETGAAGHAVLEHAGYLCRRCGRSDCRRSDRASLMPYFLVAAGSCCSGID